MLKDWAKKHGVSDAALAELRGALFPWRPDEVAAAAKTEADTQGLLRVEAGRMGFPLWRNNNGAWLDKGADRLVRYGLGNDSERVSKKIKSSDLIGCMPAVIDPADVGRTVGLFVAVEVKRPGWTKPACARDKAQEKFLAAVRSLGGIAGFANHPDNLRSIIDASFTKRA